MVPLISDRRKSVWLSLTLYPTGDIIFSSDHRESTTIYRIYETSLVSYIGPWFSQPYWALSSHHLQLTASRNQPRQRHTNTKQTDIHVCMFENCKNVILLYMPNEVVIWKNSCYFSMWQNYFFIIIVSKILAQKKVCNFYNIIMLIIDN